MSVSSSRAFAPQAVEDTGQHIRRLAGEIAGLAKADLEPEAFYAEFLPRVVTALGAAGGAVWGPGAEGGFETLFQVQLARAGLDTSPDVRPAHEHLLARALANGPVAAPPQSGGKTGHGANPTDWLLLLAPLGAETERVGVVEIFQRPEAALAAPRQLRFLASMCGLAANFFRARQLKELRGRQALWAQLEEFTTRVHASLDPVETAYVVANEGRRLAGCDRASVAVRRGGRCRLEAVSGQAELDRRSNVARLLGRLCSAAVATGEAIWYTGSTEGLAPQVERTVQQYVDKTNTKALGVLPLVRPDPDAAAEGPKDRPARPVGALVIERTGDCRVPPDMRRRVEAVRRHGGAALANALEHDGIFLRPLWQAVGRNDWVGRARALPRVAIATAGAIALAALLALYPTRLELEAKGTLQPALQRDVFAGIDGRVETVLVSHRARVSGPRAESGEPGTLLCVLRNHELEQEIARITGERATLEEQIAAIGRALLEERPNVPEHNRLSAEQGALRQQLRSLDSQLELCRRKQEDLRVHSPIGGEVVTWDVQDLLIHRPVERGHRLLRVADTDGPWQVELLVPEDRIGHVVRARRASQGPLRVSFILATDPAAAYEGTLDEIHQSAEVRGPEGNTVLATVRIDKSQLPSLMPGAGVRAKVDCGACSLGYRLLHDVIAWAQRTRFRW